MVGMGTSWRQSDVVVLSGCEVSFLCALAKAWKSTHATADSQRWSSSNLDRASAAVMCRMSLVGNEIEVAHLMGTVVIKVGASCVTKELLHLMEHLHWFPVPKLFGVEELRIGHAFDELFFQGRVCIPLGRCEDKIADGN